MRHSLLTFPFLVLFILAPSIGQTQSLTIAPASSLHTITRTFYTDRTELFAEWPPFIVGQRTRFTSHATFLGNHFKPFTEGRAVVTISGTGEILTSTGEKPERDGVFRAFLTPTKAGIGKIVVEITSAGLTERFVIANVPVYASMEEALSKQPSRADDGIISFPKEIQWQMDFATMAVGEDKILPSSAVVEQDSKPYIYVQKDPENFVLRPVSIIPRQGGRIKIIGINAKERVVIIGADKMPRI